MLIRYLSRVVAGQAFTAFAMFAATSIARADDAWPPAPRLEVPKAAAELSLPPSLSATRADAGWRITFRFKPDGAAKAVSLAGTFNGWSPQATPMAGPEPDGSWTVSQTLGDGEHLYKFVVDGAKWFHDPRNPQTTADGQGGSNSVLRIGGLAQLAKSPGKTGDGAIDAAGLLHDAAIPRYFQMVDKRRAIFRLRAFADDLQRVSLAIRNGPVIAMRLEQTGPLFSLWGCEMEGFGAAAGGSVDYTFVLEDGNTRVSDTKTYSINLSNTAVFHTPQWARDAIWYQIFPERFRNGEPSNDPTPTRAWRSDWFTPADFEARSGKTFYADYVYSRWYGGDLQGVEQKLGYLKELGVNALYFNPVFKAPTNHKYNASNYLHIDDHFGMKGDYDAIVATEDLNDPKTWKWTESDKLFLAFVKKAKGMGFRVIIDGVFNHVGPDHPAFADVRKNGRLSKYADWFTIESWEPFKWRGWFGHDDLPEFAKSATGLASQAATQHIFNVTRRWMDPNADGDPSDGIDGWRLDVPNEVPMPFWVEWRKLVKSINPDAYITGEIWDQADAWLDGRHFDAVMNYPFSRAVIGWIADKKRKITVSELDRRLAELRIAYPAAATYVMQNLMNSHDTDRLVSMMLNPDRDYDQLNRPQDNGPNYDNAKPGPECYERARLVALLQMTYVGAPMIYYGDEAGMWGADDPTCRKPMLWEDLQPYDRPEENFVMKDHLAFYQRAIALRSAHPALRSGYFHTLLTDDGADVWVFERGDAAESLIVALNASGTPREVSVAMPADLKYQVVFGDASAARISEGKIALRVPAIGGVVVRAPRR